MCHPGGVANRGRRDVNLEVLGGGEGLSIVSPPSGAARANVFPSHSLAPNLTDAYLLEVRSRTARSSESDKG